MHNSLQSAALDVDALLQLCERGQFYEDYDESTAALGKAVAAMDLIMDQLRRWEEEARYQHLERSKYKSALAELVSLKDGPKDSMYYTRKPKAWARAREALGLQEEFSID